MVQTSPHHGQYKTAKSRAERRVDAAGVSQAARLLETLLEHHQSQDGRRSGQGQVGLG